jgi:hypothetical protein
MFEERSQRQPQQLANVWTTAATSVHWRENLRYEMSKALATGCTLEHLAAVTGFDHQTIEHCDQLVASPVDVHQIDSASDGKPSPGCPRSRLCG